LRKTSLFLTFLIITMFLFGCRDKENQQFTENAKTAKTYIENEDYKVLSYEGSVSTYVLTKELVKTLPYSM
jgi:hypothetical protein